jgi:hypothetical protein
MFSLLKIESMTDRFGQLGDVAIFEDLVSLERQAVGKVISFQPLMLASFRYKVQAYRQ